MSLAALRCEGATQDTTLRFRDAIDGLDGSGAWITLLDHLHANPLSCVFTFEAQKDNASTLTIQFGGGTELEHFVNDNGSHTHVRFAEPLAEDIASTMVLQIVKIDRLRAIGESVAELDHTLAHLPPVSTRVVTDEGPPFTLRGITLDTSMVVFRLGNANKTHEIRVTGVDGEIGQLAW